MVKSHICSGKLKRKSNRAIVKVIAVANFIQTLLFICLTNTVHVATTSNKSRNYDCPGKQMSLHLHFLPPFLPLCAHSAQEHTNETNSKHISSEGEQGTIEDSPRFQSLFRPILIFIERFRGAVNIERGCTVISLLNSSPPGPRG